MYETHNNILSFIFGGMDYEHRNKYDLYYNMLLHLVKIGIKNNVERINFGQTAEATKCRIGCILEERYMLAFASSKLLTRLLCFIAPLLQNKKTKLQYNSFRF